MKKLPVVIKRGFSALIEINEELLSGEPFQVSGESFKEKLSDMQKLMNYLKPLEKEIEEEASKLIDDTETAMINNNEDTYDIMFDFVLESYRSNIKEYVSMLMDKVYIDENGELSGDYIDILWKVLEKRDADGIQYRKVDSVRFPLDKINQSKIWRHEEGFASNINMNNEDEKDSVYVELTNYEEELYKGEDGVVYTLPRPLTPLDFRIMVAVDAERRAGNTKISFNRLQKRIYNSEDNGRKLKIIRYETAIMLSTPISIDTSKSAVARGCESYKKEYGNVLTGKIVQEKTVIEHKLVNEYLEIYDTPILMEFAEHIKQITEFSEELYRCPINKPRDYDFDLQDYIYYRLARGKKDCKKDKKNKGRKTVEFVITCKSLCDHCEEYMKKEHEAEKRRQKDFLRIASVFKEDTKKDNAEDSEKKNVDNLPDKKTEQKRLNDNIRRAKRELSPKVETILDYACKHNYIKSYEAPEISSKENREAWEKCKYTITIEM